VQDERHTRGGEVDSFAGHSLGELFGKLPKDSREIDSCFLQNPAFAEDARTSAAPAWAIPTVFTKLLLAIQMFESPTNTVLESQEVVRELFMQMK
jgi:hypothetical protein